VMLRRVMMAGASAPPLTGWNAAVAALPALWGWWKLDEIAAAAGVATDSSGNGRNGAYTAAGTQTSGLFAGSTAAQATLGGRVSLPSDNPTVSALTIGAFIRTSTAGTEQQILSSHGSGTSAWQFRKNSSANSLEFITISPSVTTTTAATSVSDGNSHLAIMVFDSTLLAASGRVKLYLDGVQDGASTGSIVIGSGATSIQPAIGSRASNTNTGLWSGAIDECFICLSALSSSDVAALYAARNS
jgi:hypothetical protein